MSTITVKISDAMGERLEFEARRRKTSKSEIVRYCVDQVLSGKAVGEAPSFYELSKDICGRQKGGPSDLASNSEYLKDFGR